MRKSVEYQVRFDVPTVERAVGVLRDVLPDGTTGYFVESLDTLTVRRGAETWSHDDINEFFADFSRPHDMAIFRITRGVHTIQVMHGRFDTTVEVTIDNRSSIQRVFRVFDDAVASMPPVNTVDEVALNPRVFIGHGGSSSQWRQLKDHLHDHHGYEVEAYESGARSGHTIRDILQDLLSESDFAVLVLTGEDAQTTGGLRARQNVVHESGLFQGKLGFSRTVILLEEGVEMFSNLDGIQYISFSRDNIREAFGDVLATLRREFPARR